MKRVLALLALVSFMSLASSPGTVSAPDMSPAPAGDGIPRWDGAAAQQTVELTIQDYRFSPREVRIKAGDTVRWANREKRTSHSVLFPAENGLESDRLFPDERWQRTFTQPGSYSYRCGPHEEMKGIIVVE